MNILDILVVASFAIVVSAGVYVYFPQAEAITITNFHVKVVVQFDKPGITETQITNYLVNTVWPEMRDVIITKLDNNFDTYTIEKSLKVQKIQGDTWEFYPKFVISGETTLTRQQLRNGFDSTIDNLKDILQTHMEIQEATNVKYHMHKSIGSIDE